MIGKPGIQKPEPLDATVLDTEIRDLKHGSKRTAGTGELYRKRCKQISRRELHAMVRLMRQELNSDTRAYMRRIEWTKAGMVWAMDDTEYARSEDKKKVFLHQVQDLASRHKFDPLVGRLAKGRQVADNLRVLFDAYGAPLVLKRDNHKNLNAAPVNEVLEEFCVIALNSPHHYPPYNGGIERGIREVKQCLQREYGCTGFCPNLVRSCAPLAVNELNHQNRPCLDGSTPCLAFSVGPENMKQYDRSRRKEVHSEITEMAARITEHLEDDGPRAARTAWRIAVETWLRRNGHVTVSVNGKVLPHSC
jgi:hypothetical protein